MSPLQFKRCFDNCYKPMLVYCGVYHIGYEEAKDVVLEVFVRFWVKEWIREASDKELKNMIFISVRNEILNRVKKQNTFEKLKREIAYIFEESEEPTVEEILNHERMRFVLFKVNSLSNMQKKVINLAYITGLKNWEIAETLNISIFTVKEHKARALNFLKQQCKHLF